MSASLVGSEMCIRDSSNTATPCDATVQQQSQVHAALNVLQGQQQRPASVSYTHLTLPTICSV
eukprot:4732290-Alexandrium_andersonii.AAC.1